MNPKPASVQRRLEKSLKKDLDKVQVLALLGWHDSEFLKGHVAPAPLLKRIDLVIRKLTKTRKALTPWKGRAA